MADHSNEADRASAGLFRNHRKILWLAIGVGVYALLGRRRDTVQLSAIDCGAIGYRVGTRTTCCRVAWNVLAAAWWFSGIRPSYFYAYTGNVFRLECS
jgi:hypothetical protein